MFAPIAGFKLKAFCVTTLWAISFYAFSKVPAGAVPFVNTNKPEIQLTEEEISILARSHCSASGLLGLVANDSQFGKPADLVLKNGAICTMDAARRWFQAMVIRDGRIVYLGSDASVRPWIKDTTKIIDLKGGMVLPGFHDTHVHLAEGGVELDQLSLEGASDIQEVEQKIKEYMQKNPKKEWILGGNWALTLFANANPKKELLDAIVKDKPVFLISNDGHSAWANSKAIKMAGVTNKTTDPKLGRIERDPVTGEPSGAFREAAVDLIRKKAPRVTDLQMLQGTRNAVKYANSFGITAIIEANTGEDILKAYKKLDKDGSLSLKVRAAVETDPEGRENQVDRAIALRQKYSGKRLHIGAAKFFADGVVETHTAALLSPYLDKKEETGISNWTDDKFASMATLFDSRGFQIHIHAIGDRAVRQALNTIEVVRKKNTIFDNRPHIAHLQLIDKADMPRFRKLGVTATFQPFWAYRDVFVKDLTVPVLGEERTNNMYPINSLLRQGAVLSAGSDWTVSSLNPLDAIEVAVTRKGLFDKPEVGKDEPLNLDERVNLMDILAAYTCGGAFVDHSDRETGSLEPGKAADLIVLDKNLFDIPNTDIHKVKVLQTMIDGEIVFDRERQTADPEAVKERF
jgi:predicted amidohydrolase YtcJ